MTEESSLFTTSTDDFRFAVYIFKLFNNHLLTKRKLFAKINPSCTTSLQKNRKPELTDCKDSELLKSQ